MSSTKNSSPHTAGEGNRPARGFLAVPSHRCATAWSGSDATLRFGVEHMARMGWGSCRGPSLGMSHLCVPFVAELVSFSTPGCPRRAECSVPAPQLPAQHVPLSVM